MIVLNIIKQKESQKWLQPEKVIMELVLPPALEVKSTWLEDLKKIMYRIVRTTLQPRGTPLSILW